MAVIKKEEYPIKDNGFTYLGNRFDCKYAIKRDIKMILQEANTSHKDTFDKLYDKNTLRANKIYIYVDENSIPIFGMIIYIINYKDEEGGRYACGGYYTFDLDNTSLMPHPCQESICW